MKVVEVIVMQLEVETVVCRELLCDRFVFCIPQFREAEAGECETAGVELVVNGNQSVNFSFTTKN